MCIIWPPGASPAPRPAARRPRWWLPASSGGDINYVSIINTDKIIYIYI